MQKQNETKKGENSMKGKYLSPKADLTFKLVFAEHKDLMMSLLNALLPLAENAPITKYDTLNTLEYVDILKVMDFVEKSAMSEAQLYAYERFWDEVNRSHVLKENSFKEGEKRGEMKKAIEIAKKLKLQGMSDTDISSLTGLGLDEVSEL